MGVPTITTVTPNFGLSRGKKLVRIGGSNFQLAPPPPASGRAPTPNPSVEVLFGTTPATDVRVLTSGLLDVLTPPGLPGATSITVRNIAQDGTPIPGESITVLDAYEYRRPDLTRRGNNESNLALLVRTLIGKLRAEVIDNVELTVHTDYPDEGMADVAFLAKLPGLVLAGPRLRTNRFQSTNQARTVIENGIQVEKKPGRTVDVVFTVIGADELMQPELNLLQEVTMFFNENITLTLPLELGNPGAGTTALEMEIEDDFGAVGGANNSNVRAFSGTVVIRGLDLDDEYMGTRATYPVQDVLPTGSVLQAGPVIFTGQPGTNPAPPHAPNPDSGVGNLGPIEQIFPTDED